MLRDTSIAAVQVDAVTMAEGGAGLRIEVDLFLTHPLSAAASQVETALHLVKSMISMGGASRWPSVHVHLVGGVAETAQHGLAVVVALISGRRQIHTSSTDA